MPRPPRVHVPGGHHHVILRGNHRQDIFNGPADRDKWEEYLAEALADCGAAIHAYCWMTNHVHMVLQIGAVPLGRVMHRIAGRYSRWFQHRIASTGHLFERRYGAIPITTDPYLLASIRYIHRNPVRAGIVADAADYPWSSHRHYLLGEANPWLITQLVLSMLNEDAERARLIYRDFMLEAPDEPPRPGPICPPPRSAETVENDPSARSCVKLTAPTLNGLASKIAADHGLQLDSLCSASRVRRIVQVRAIVAWQAMSSGTATLSEVATLFGRSTAAMSQAIASLRRTHPQLLARQNPVQTT